MSARAGDVQGDPLWQQAEWHASRKEWPQAIASFQALSARRPNDARVLVQLSYVHSLAGDYRAARDFALRAATLAPREPAVVAELVARLRTFNTAPALHALVKAQGPLDRVPIPLLLAIAAQYSYLNEQERALALLDEARRGDPDFPPTLLARAQILMYLGRFDEAQVDARAAVKRAPEIAQGWWLLSRLQKQTPQSNVVDEIRTQLQRPGRRPLEAAQLAEGLHKALDDLGDIEGAWSALELMCRAKRSTLDYRAEDARALVDALIAMPTGARGTGDRRCANPDLHRRHASLRHDAAGTAARRPSRCPRGGGSCTTSPARCAGRPTTIAAASSTRRSSNARRPRTSRASARATCATWNGAWARNAASPTSCRRTSSTSASSCARCRSAKVLHMVRDPMETCFSNLRELFSDANPYSYDQLELADFYQPVPAPDGALARGVPGSHPWTSTTPTLTRDPESVMRGVAAFCGLEFDPAMLAMQAAQARRGDGERGAGARHDRCTRRAEVGALRGPPANVDRRVARRLRARQ